MSGKRTNLIVLIPILVGVIVIFFGMSLIVPVQEKIDDFRHVKFAQKIAPTDHIIVSRWTDYPSRREIRLSLTGDDAKRVVQAVSSGRAERKFYKIGWDVRAKFLAGTNVLAEIQVSEDGLFIADGRQYRDGSYLPQGGPNGALYHLVYVPAMFGVTTGR